MDFKLPGLPYKYSDLEPYIDKETMEIHYTKHHQTYIDNLNKALANVKELQNQDVIDVLKNINKVPQDLRQTVINNAGGHANHTLFWNIMSPVKTKPEGKLLEAINSRFGSIGGFTDSFTEKAMSVFGSGWAFLILTPDKKLELKRHSFQNSPVMQGNIPLLGIDVWEHAYYLKYQNRKADYVKAWWNVVNWKQVVENFDKASG